MIGRKDELLTICLTMPVLYASITGINIAGELPIIGVFFMGLMRILPSMKNLGNLSRGFMADLPNMETVFNALNEMKIKKEKK